MKQQSLTQIIDALKYDFADFDLQNFVQHIENRRRREILCLPWRFDPDVSAIWLRAETADYVFYNSIKHSVQQTHSILHELAHIILGHPCKPIKDILPPELLAELKIIEPLGLTRIILPNHETTPDELEAEAFVFDLQRRIVAANRLAALTSASSSNETLNQYVSLMAFDI